ncbi:response regulator transcription factor [Amycolatopsis sp. FDAARGOS 1241]|uniref:response regulator n=1 Tax=Amycolatopsis sp. FDAARGOS 1241 TaxID=2778070 RepID=UPI001EF2A6E9|nr:response regulator transcription factor [Amycolatopsis sp. FDAARGOS 1241]
MSGPLRVVISDDDAMIRDALREVLDEQPDIEVVAVGRDADEAITLAEHHRPAVAVLDVRMPGGGGARAAEEIVARCPGTAVLAFSAYSDRASMTAMETAGAVEYLTKGVPNREIVAAVRRLAGRGRG